MPPSVTVIRIRSGKEIYHEFRYCDFDHLKNSVYIGAIILTKAETKAFKRANDFNISAVEDGPFVTTSKEVQNTSDYRR